MADLTSAAQSSFRPEAREAWRAEGLFRDDALGVRLRRAAMSHPKARVSFLSSNRPRDTTCGALLQEAERVASALAALGLTAGDAVAVQLPSWHECVVVYLACLRAGFVIVPIINIYGPHEVSFILRDSGARTLILPAVYRGRDYRPLAHAYLASGDCDRVIIVGGDQREDAPLLSWSAVLESAADEPPIDPNDPDAIATIIYTSGTTSNPKGVRHTHNSLGTQIDGDPFFAVEQGAGRALTIVPAGHLAGMLDILRPFISGEASLIMDEWDVALAVDTISREAITRCKGTPYHLNAVIDRAEREGRDLSSLGVWVIGGTSVPASVVRRALGAGIVACRSYGSTEHPTISRNTPADPEDKRIGTDGRPQQGVLIRFVDEEGCDVAAGEEGEILTFGPQLFAGYTDPKLDVEAFTSEGWFRTGDIGRLDADGYLSITDRKKDIVIRGGENISAKEVEDVLGSHPSIADIAVVAAPDAVMGERVCAFVILHPGSAFTLADALAHIVGHGLAKQKSPERIVVVDEFPRTALGKVKKAELKAQLGV
jgi:acyl-CoA synthetase (AMP-forming)/AMP-acid ligase II